MNNRNLEISFRDLDSINLRYFENDLTEIPWDTIYEIDDIDDKVLLLNKNIIRLLDLHAPIKTFISNRNRK